MPTPNHISSDEMSSEPNNALPLNIVLVGFMATGKTTIGRRLARKAGFKFVDCDHEIEKQQGMKISEIFSDHGEEHFRQLEAEYLKSLRDKQSLVISTGGGVVTHELAREILPTLGYVVWLHAKKREIHERVMRNTNRPLVRTPDPWKTIKTLLKQRKPHYKKVAHLKIKTHGLDINETVQGILDSACYHFATQRTATEKLCAESTPNDDR